MTTLNGQKELEAYTGTIANIERLHRLLLDMLKLELDSIGLTEVNNVQALLLYSIGDAEMTAGELRSRGLYLGSNVSYNLKKLVQTGFIHHEKSALDRRSVRVRLTPAGQKIRKIVHEMYLRHSILLRDSGGITPEEIGVGNRILTNLELFWQTQLDRRQ